MLTPQQIGEIAEHIKASIELHPNPPPEDNSVGHEHPTDDCIEDWEKCLKDLVDRSYNLPSYKEVECDPCLEFLVHYYGD